MDYTHEEITAEMKRIGLGAYPSASDFTDNEITERMAATETGYVTVANLHGENHTAEVLAAFAKVAQTLNQTMDETYTMKLDYQQIVIVREMRPSERRSRALESLRSERYQRNRDEALNHLRDENLGSVRDYA